jgi:hypothetical protein
MRWCSAISLTAGSRPRRATPRKGRGKEQGIPPINHERRRFIKNKRCRQQPHRFDDVVNRTAGFVYQSDAFLNLVRRA